MDTSGRIYSTCKKCGAEVLYDRDCSKCGEPSGTAETLSSMLKDAIMDEIPDPLERMREALRKEHQRRQRKKAR